MTEKTNCYLIPLFKGFKQNENYKTYIQGTASDVDTFSLALKRYIDELAITYSNLCNITGISTTTIYRYLKKGKNANYAKLCAICIAMRLPPARQRHIFSLLGYVLPSEKKCPLDGDYIVQKYLDSCAFFEEYTLIACNRELINNNSKPLTNLLE